jgi:rare lipoprotein A
MPMRRTIGISFACLVTSACATSKTPETSKIPEENPSHYTDEAAKIPDPTHYADEAAKVPDPTHYADEAAKVPNSCCRLVPIVGRGQFGKAAWYDFVGKKTASGEILDSITPTAAHRSLPLASYAQVTDLDNSRSVIVKINDRGPYTPGRIIDLSPGAADVLEMKRAGVASVVIEPLVYEAAPVIASVQPAGAAVTQ